MLHSKIQSWSPWAIAQLTSKSIFFSGQTALLFALFFIVRFASYYLEPYGFVQALIIFALVMILGAVYFESQETAWMILLGELFLGGSGHFFEFYGLSLRTILILTYISLWIFFRFSNPAASNQLKLPHRLFILCVPLFVLVAFSSIVGLVNNHAFSLVVQDVIPYIFLFLLLPTYHLFSSEKIQHYFIRLLVVFIVGSALYALFTFIVFRLGISELQDPFYKWFRDVAAGKITMLTPYFFRIVLPEHLLIAPISLVVLSLLMKNEKHHMMWRILFICCMFILALNMSRAYVLGIFVGTFVLLYKHKLKEWFKETAWAATIFILVFVGVNIVSSLGKDAGLGVLGLRAQSVVDPRIEQSTQTRMALIPGIINTYAAHPFLGAGLGATIFYTDPKTFNVIETNQFDWGYFEMITELGPVGFLYFMFLILTVLVVCIKKIHKESEYHDLHVGLVAGLVALLVINITTPAFFHVFGILYLMFTIAFLSKTDLLFAYSAALIYRVFNKATHLVR